MAILKESWSSLPKPTSINVKESSDYSKSETVVMEPFKRGYGNTLGNALRRVLLSSIAGFAVTSVKIEGALHEYGSLDGVYEDVSEIIMNIKSLAITKETSAPTVLKLSSEKEGPVYAGSIETEDGVEIINKDAIICHLAKGGKINITMKVDSGTGYVIADGNRKKEKEIGFVDVDALFSPVKVVAYKVENARVGQITDYDKLILNIETNGTITPRDAVGVAAKILQEQLQVFVNFDVEKYDQVEEKEVEGEIDFNKNLLKTVDELELSVRSYNCLKNEKITYVGDLVSKTEADMLKLSNFGRKSLNELKDNLKSMSLSFGGQSGNFIPKERLID